MSRRLFWLLITNISGQPIGPIFKGQAEQEEIAVPLLTKWDI